MSAISVGLVTEGVTTYEMQIERIRNNLSHGNRNYVQHELQPWMASLELVSRAHLMRLLGFDDDGISLALAPELVSAVPPENGD
jgi:hypothetical protein